MQKVHLENRLRAQKPSQLYTTQSSCDVLCMCNCRKWHILLWYPFYMFMPYLMFQQESSIHGRGVFTTKDGDHRGHGFVAEMMATGHNMYDTKAFFWSASPLMGFVGLGSRAVLAFDGLHVKIVKITVSLWSVILPYQLRQLWYEFCTHLYSSMYGFWISSRRSDMKHRTAHVPLSQLAWRHVVSLSVDAWCVMIHVLLFDLVWIWVCDLPISCTGSCFWRASWKLSSSADGLGRAKVEHVTKEI